MNYTNVVFEGGGVLGIAYVGCIKILHEKGILQNIKNFAGTSVGSLIASLLACKCSPDKLENILKTLDFNIFKDDSFFIIGDIERLLNDYGWYKGEKFKEYYESILKEITGTSELTFKDIFEKYGNELIVVGTNLSRKSATYFSKTNCPNMKVSDAVRISMSIPLFFKSVKLYNKNEKTTDIYVDGGLIDNYPLWIFDENDEPNPNTIGFKLLSTSEMKEKVIGKPSFISIDGIVDYFKALVETSLYNLNKLHIKTNDWNRTVAIPIGNISSINFDLTDDEKDFLFTSGMFATKNFLEKSI